MHTLLMAASLALSMAASAAMAEEAPFPPPATVAVPSQAEVMHLPDDLRALLHERVVAPGGNADARLQRLLELTFEDGGLELHYDFEFTRTVAETWRDRRANCLSFTLLFVALAREAGLDARVQEAGEVLAWYQNQGVIYGANHVNAGVRGNGRHRTFDLDRNILATREHPRAIDDARAMAHFHNNRGAEHMAAGDVEAARVLLRAALADDPTFVAAWNNLGVLLQRESDLDGAEHAYQTALRLAPQSSPTLSNLVSLYQRRGNVGNVQRYARRLEKVQGGDAFHQFVMAVRCEERGDYACAIDHYRAALRLRHNEHQFRFGLARAYFFSGDIVRSQREMARAHTLANTEQDRSVYMRKLEHLKRWQEHSAGQAGRSL